MNTEHPTINSENHLSRDTLQRCDVALSVSLSKMVASLCWWFTQRSQMGLHMLQIEIGSDRDAGKIVAFLIRRNQLRTKRKSFHYWLNVASSDSKYTFASGLFDRNGMLKQRLYGNFGPETNLGNILYIRNVTLKAQHSRRNLGCKVLRKFLEIATKQPHTADGWWLAGRTAKCLSSTSHCKVFTPADQAQL